MTTDFKPTLTPKLILGVGAVVAGVLLTIDNLGIADTGWLFRYWPLAPLAVGLLILAQAREGNGRMGGALLAFLGGWLLLNTLDVIDANLFELFWPMVLIVVGVNLVRQTWRREKRAALDANDEIQLFAIMAGVKRKSTARRFRHAEISSMWGGCDLDLRQATIPSGESATVEVFALMGGHKILVPEEWRIDVRAFPFMGGVDDKTGPPADASAPRLIIEGFVMMGGVVIQN